MKKKRKAFNSTNGRGEQCWYCKRGLEASGSRSALAATRDHVVPKRAGGRYRVWCCRACNSLKGDMFPDQWRAWREQNPEWWKLYRAEPEARVLERTATSVVLAPL